ncbi:HYR-like domain-containing protein [Flavobacterium foetidum]|uniref:HYR-like domain-containing protein n=1 Tax=Flavobacterium foetidum TaxID=2026681 RepID=UPI0010752CB1|nr:gliding motility-associated C-terminal domain-containing protein [Flavobacterium foetidum]KAF2515745.1 T9SS type B sorting domain-containing protein [Flavobacterium foetidum]
MKNITSLKNISFRYVFTTFILIFNIHLSFSQIDLRTCGYSCTSNNYTLTDVYLSLSNVNGTPITNTTCTIGQVQQVYIYLNYTSNSNSSIHYTRMNSDLKINGTTTFLNVLLGDIAPGSNKKLIYGPFNWTCGDELSLSNTIIAWKTNSNSNPGPNYNCGSYTNSQCDFTNSFTISKPLAVQFTYKACKVGTSTTVSFTSTTNGGKTPYTYAWDFKNDGGAPDSTLPNPTYTYTTSNNTAKLTVTDSQNISNTYILPIVEPTELMLSETHSAVSCNGGTSNITLTVTGGTPNYTYSWSNGAVTKDLTNVGPGSYTVTVTDSNNCSKQLTVVISGGDTIKPIIDPLPATSTIDCPSLPVFAQATATDNSGTVTSLTYVDQNTPGSCAGTYSITRTWTAKDACNNTSLPVSQTINVVDVTAPTWTTAANSLNVTLECSNASGLANAQATFPTASDMCDADVADITKTSGQFVATQGCGNSGTYTNTWTAKDDCGNISDVFTQVITIQDTAAPTWTTAATALNVTLECSDAAGLASAQAMIPTAADLCDADVADIIKTNGQFVVTEGCGNSGTYTNTWTVKDDCGNISDVFTQVITIQDTAAPTWTTAATALNVTLECSDAAGLASAQAMIPTASDLCDADVADIIKTNGQFIASQNCGNSGTYTNTWTVKDDCGNISDVFTQVITIQDTAAPTWTTAPTALNVTLECSDASGLANAQAMIPTASDMCDADVADIIKTSGQFVATLGCGNSGTYTNTWTVKDNCGNTSDVFTQVITIQDTAAPTWTTAPTALNVTLECSDASGLANAQAMIPTASDMCDADVADIIKTSGQFVATQGCGNSGTYTNSWTVKDDCGNISDVFTQVITIQDTAAPTWTTAPTALNVTLECSDASGLANAQAMIPTAADLCDADVADIIKTSGQFVVTEGCGNSGTYTNTWTVKDDCGNISDVFTQVITIQDTAAPTWTTTPTALNVTLECSDASGLANAQAMIPVASDLCDADVADITKTSGQFVATQGCGNSGTYTNTWTVKDDCGNISDVFTQVITIQDTAAPTWKTAPTALNVTLECSDASGLADAQAMTPTASDLCDADVADITKTNGQFVAAAGCGNSGTYTNTWTAKDDCGNISDVFTQVITIQDTAAPTWTTAPTALDVTLECSDASGLANAQAMFPAASDLCDADVADITKTSGQFVATQGCGNSGTYTNTWTVKDDCGNISDVFTQVITIQDTAAPTWTTAPTALNVTLECSDASGLANAQAMFPASSDLCDADVADITKTSGQFVASQNCGNAGTYTNTWTAKDDCGNISDVFTQIITIQDTAAPVWTTASTALNVTLECSDDSGLASAQAMTPTASDLCDADVADITKTNGQFVAAAGCGNSGTYTNTWTAKDDCGNISDVFTQIITIQDTTAPTWTTAPTALNVTLECSDAAGLTTAFNQAPIATDVCSSEIIYTKSTGIFKVSESCSNAGTYTNTWIAKDNCGNLSSTFTQVITIQDTKAPVFTSTLPANITVSCDAVPVPAEMIAFDGCNENLPVVFTETKAISENGCASNYTLTRNWKTSDCSGNIVSHTQIVTVRDTTPPTGTAPANVVGLRDRAEIPAPNPQAITDAKDNCSPNVTISITDTSNEGTGCAGNIYILTRSYTLSDCAGNKTVLVQTFTVESVTNITSEACTDDSTLINLSTLLPSGTLTTGTWTDTSGSNALQGNILNPFGLTLGNYTFEYQIANENCTKKIVLNMLINDDCKVLACGNILVHNAFSPNGDGINDVFEIDGINDLTCYPGNTVEIYNRWGILVFETTNYNNSTNAFDGNSRGRTTVKQSEGLPTGTYFYILNYQSVDGNNRIQNNKKDGFLYLSR